MGIGGPGEIPGPLHAPQLKGEKIKVVEFKVVEVSIFDDARCSVKYLIVLQFQGFQEFHICQIGCWLSNAWPVQYADTRGKCQGQGRHIIMASPPHYKHRAKISHQLPHHCLHHHNNSYFRGPLASTEQQAHERVALFQELYS